MRQLCTCSDGWSCLVSSGNVFKINEFVCVRVFPVQLMPHSASVVLKDFHISALV